MNKLELLLNSGFNLYEAKILTALNEVPASTAKDISQISEVPKNKVYEILEELLRSEIIEVLPTKPKQYQSPRLKELIKHRLKEEAKQLESLSNQADELLEETKVDKEPKDGFWVTEGQQAMISRISNTLNTAKKESIAYIDVWTAKDESLLAVKKATKRGVRFYFLGSIDSSNRKLAKKYHDLGVEIRHLPIKEASYSIFDTRQILLRLTRENVISIWVENKYLARIMREHFFENWKKGKKIEF